ncbi:hypothetical protein [Chlamydia gallinacea]|uniref:hypothetical protein n=1 Tax=Chlamydia gallinacea TaxID=1457153 RepID=UPI0024E19EDF|nr:hypothetical protein [Chlamydia gallinacea]
MRILLTLFLCLLLPCQSIFGKDASISTAIAVENTDNIFESFEEALAHVKDCDIPILMVLLSLSPSPVLDEVVKNGFIEEDPLFFQSLKDFAAFAVLRPTEIGDACVTSFLQTFPGVCDEQGGIYLITFLCSEDEVCILNASPISDLSNLY